MQALTNKANSDQASIAFATAANGIASKYSTTQLGANALPNLQPAVDEIDKARQEARKALTNPMAQSMFDADSRRTAFNLVGEMRRHADAQQNQYIVKSSQDRIASAGDQMAANPNNPAFESQFLEISKRESNFQALHAGLDQPGDDTHAKELSLKVQGQYYSEAAKAMAVTDPNAAMDFIRARQGLMDPKSYATTLAGLRPAVMANDVAAIGHVAAGSVLGTGVVENVRADAKGFFNSIVPGVTISSGARTPEHNAAVGGVPNSEHIPGNGMAYDLVPPAGMSTAQLAAKMQGLGAHQVIDEGNHVHVGWSEAQLTASGQFTSTDLASRAGAAETRAREIAAQKYPGLPLVQDEAARNARTFVMQQASAQAQVESDAFQDILGTVQAGQIGDLHSLLSQPGAQDAYNSLRPSQRRAVDGALRVTGNELTPQRQANIVQVEGMLAQAKAGDPSHFLSTDLAAIDLPTSARLTYEKAQQDIRQKPGNVDPNAKFLKGVMSSPEFKSTLQALKIQPPSKTNSGADYYHFLGAVQAQKEAWDASNPGKVPDAKATMGILARAGAQVPQGNYFLGVRVGAAEPTTAFAVSDEEAKAATAYLQSHGLPVNELNIGHLVHGNRIIQQERARGGQ
jgi:hypothetical protein